MKMSITSILRVLIVASILLPGKTFAQLQRVYANNQTTGGTVVIVPLYTTSNVVNAIDGNPQTYSSIAPTAVGNVWQQLQFPSTVAANTPVKIKIGGGTGLLGVGISINVQAYNGGTAIGSATSLSSLLAVLNGDAQQEITITPSGNYDRIRVTLSTTLGLGLNLNVYGAYYYQTPAGSVACNLPIDELHGVNANGIATVLNGVTNPVNTVDGNINTYAVLNADLGVVAYTQQTILYPGPSTVEDSLRITFSLPSSLVSLTALTSTVTIITYNGATVVDNINNNPSLLNIRLVSNGTSPSIIAFKPSGIFDRVEVRIGGVLSVLSSLRLHEIERVTPNPTVINTSTCSGTATTIQATGSGSSVFSWFTQLVGGVAQATGNNFNTANITGITNYYVEAKTIGCTNISGRATIQVSPLPLPQFTTTSLPNTVAGVPYSVQINVTNGTAPYNFSVFSGSLPNNITMSPIGLISGTTLLSQAFNFTGKVTDDNTCSTTQNYSVPLSIKMVQFSAALKDNHVQLDWKTENESGVISFTVERSLDAHSFETIGDIKSSGVGNNIYSFSDNPANTGFINYRLKINKADGSFEYSSVLSVKKEEVYAYPEFVLIPNPAKEKISISIKNTDAVAMIAITDMLGKEVFRSGVSGNKLNVTVPQGIYLVYAYNENGRVLQTSKAVIY